MARAPVVDADVHLSPSKQDLEPHCDLPWRAVLAEPGRAPPWTIGGGPHPYPGHLPAPTPAPTDPGQLARAQAERDVDAAILMPGPLLKIGVLPTAEYAAALAAAYNRWLAGWLGGAPGHHGALLVAPQDPAAAAAQIEQHAGDARMRAVVAPMVGIEPMLGDRRYDPIYAAAAAAGLPLVLHAGGGQSLLPASPHLITQYHNGFEQLAMSQPLIATAHLVSMVGTGVFARYPALRVLFLGAGLSWYAHILLRMDKEYNENRRDVPFFADRLSTYLRRQVWLGTGPLELGLGAAGLATLVRISAGEGHVVYGSGWPHPDADPPPTVRQGFSDPVDCARVLGESACDLFGIAVR
jgi:predicted TIM-barrel fold metal-dependent hydrolase